VLARSKIAQSLGPGTHASTFGGNPLVTAAGIAALTAINDRSLLENCRSMGAYLMDELSRLKEKHPVVKHIRGKGLLIGAELMIPGAQIVNQCMKKGILINCIQDTVLRFIPPLIVTKEEIDRAIDTLDAEFSNIEAY
jgi:acetylornithine/succinyldiaminopimelate/putrescine aminotransferase